jgi:hypothetical protein
LTCDAWTAKIRLNPPVVRGLRPIWEGACVDPLRLSIALSPLAAYVLLLGLINLSSRPLVTSGGRDLAALGLGISGLVVVGPLELFFPELAVEHLGGYVWLLLLGLYALLIVLLMLTLRPRLVLYNMTVEQLRPTLANVVTELDADARWAGECLVLPRLGVQLYVEPFQAMRNVQLVSSGPHQSFAGWRRLERTLVKALKGTSSPPNPYGFSLVFFGLLMVALITYSVVSDTEAVAQALGEMLRQ